MSPERPTLQPKRGCGPLVGLAIMLPLWALAAVALARWC